MKGLELNCRLGSTTTSLRAFHFTGTMCDWIAAKILNEAAVMYANEDLYCLIIKESEIS